MKDASPTPIAQPATSPQPGAVLLVSCYELGHAPHGLAMPAAFLQQAGIEPVLVDLSVDPLPDASIDAARVAAISVPMHTALQLGRRVARRIRERNPSCRIVFHGHSAHLHAEALLRRESDVVLGGESEEALVDTVQRVLRGEDPRPHLHTMRRQQFPLPRRQGMPGLEAYARLEWRGEHRLAGYLETTRGCRHLCRHCPIPAVYAGRLFAVQKEAVLDDARQQVAAGAQHLTFGDPDFLNAPGQGLRLLAALHDEFPEVTFDFTAKIEHLIRHAAHMPDLARHNVLFVVSAVEVLNDDILAILDKGHTRNDVQRAHGILRDAGISLRPSFLPFTPWTRWRDVQDIVQWVEEADLVDSVDAVQYCIRLLVPQGSLLERHPRMQPHLSAVDEKTLSWTWRHPEESLEHLQQQLAQTAEEAAARDEDPDATFERVRELVFSEGPTQAPARHAGHRRRRQRPPRLTEPWFC